MKRRPLIAGNWKMYKTIPEAVATGRELVRLTADLAGGVDVMVAPPFTALSPLTDALKGSRISLGAQNLHWEAEGAYTGEISAAMLTSAGCRYVIIGHSERRRYFGDTDETVNRKLKAALGHHLIPVVCVGETERQRDAGETFSVLDKQVQKGLESFSADALAPLVLAYEPVWAIGTGKTATTDQAQEVHGHLRRFLEKNYGNPLANSVRILYGGSVKAGNIDSLMAMPDVDGALVGGASLEADSFSRIAHFKTGGNT